jgi:hypothetical protein
LPSTTHVAIATRRLFVGGFANDARVQFRVARLITVTDVGIVAVGSRLTTEATIVTAVPIFGVAVITHFVGTFIHHTVSATTEQTVAVSANPAFIRVRITPLPVVAQLTR